MYLSGNKNQRKTYYYQLKSLNSLTFDLLVRDAQVCVAGPGVAHAPGAYVQAARARAPLKLPAKVRNTWEELFWKKGREEKRETWRPWQKL
jgi:hypothetical protein